MFLLTKLMYRAMGCITRFYAAFIVTYLCFYDSVENVSILLEHHVAEKLKEIAEEEEDTESETDEDTESETDEDTESESEKIKEI